jgi:hypothetical protein
LLTASAAAPEIAFIPPARAACHLVNVGALAMGAYGRITPALPLKELNRSLFITADFGQVLDHIRFRKLRMFLTIHGSIFHDEVGHWLGNPRTKVKICVIYILPLFGVRVSPGNGFSTFSHCPSLSAITVDPNNSAFSSMAGVLFNKSQTMLICCPMGKAGSYTIPNSVTNISQYACALCISLSSIYFTDNAPILSPGVFSGDTATVYYLPWTTGWTTPFGGLTAVPWLPQAQTSDATFGVQTNQFGFNINWVSGQTVVVEASTDLISWQSVGTNTLTGGSSYFSDSQWTKYPGRYYRLRSP